MCLIFAALVAGAGGPLGVGVVTGGSGEPEAGTPNPGGLADGEDVGTFETPGASVPEPPGDAEPGPPGARTDVPPAEAGARDRSRCLRRIRRRQRTNRTAAAERLARDGTTCHYTARRSEARFHDMLSLVARKRSERARHFQPCGRRERLRREPAVEDAHARVGRGEFAIARAHAFVKGVILAFHAVDRGPGRLRACGDSRARERDGHVDEEGQLRGERARRRRRDRAERREIEAAAIALVGERREAETVRQHPPAGGERGPHDLGDELRARGVEQQHFGEAIDCERGVEKERAHAVARRCPAGLARRHDVDAARTQTPSEARGERRFSARLDALDAEEPRARGERSVMAVSCYAEAPVPYGRSGAR